MKNIIKLVAVLAIVFLAASPVLADYAVGAARIDRETGYFSGSGGEFSIGNSALSNSAYVSATRNKDAAAAHSFQSFCVEYNEHVSIPQTVYIVVSTSGPTGSQAVMGGQVSPPEGILPDPLDAKTAYLYTLFARGQLSGYNYAPGAAREASADALQNAIWYIEGETALTTGAAFYAAALEATTPGNDSLVTWTGIGNVRVLNLYADKDYTVKLQDQLYLIPAPAAALLALVGLPIISWVKRRVS